MQALIDYITEATKPIFTENDILQNAAREILTALDDPSSDANTQQAYALLAI